MAVGTVIGADQFFPSADASTLIDPEVSLLKNSPVSSNPRIGNGLLLVTISEPVPAAVVTTALRRSD